MSCTTHVVYTVQSVQMSCTTQYTLYSMYRFHVQHSTYCTICTDHRCWLQWNCWGQTTVFQKPSFVESNEDQKRHVSLYICVVCVYANIYIKMGHFAERLKIWNGNIPKSIMLRNTNQYMYRSSQHINNITSEQVLCTFQVLMELDRQTGSLHHKDNKSFQFHIILNTLQYFIGVFIA